MLFRSKTGPERAPKRAGRDRRGTLSTVFHPSRDAIREVARQVRPHVRCTPWLTLASDDLGLTDAPLSLKLELLQHAGSFKARGAFANLLLRRVPEAGVAAASGGNHGAAVAWAASRLGHRATIFVPSVATPAKLAQIHAYGADLVIAGDRYDEARQACERYVAESGALGVHAYDAEETLLGTATLDRKSTRLNSSH